MVGLMEVPGLLAESKSWMPADQQEMNTWFGKYFDWLATSKLAGQEGVASNNHGTFYDAQFAALALFLGKPDAARELLLKDRDDRIAKQIEPDGSSLGDTLKFYLAGKFAESQSHLCTRRFKTAPLFNWQLNRIKTWDFSRLQGRQGKLRSNHFRFSLSSDGLNR